MGDLIVRTLESAVAAVIAAIATIGYAGFVLSLMWGWFVVPLGVETISWVHAIGLMVVISVLNPGWLPEESNKRGFADDLWNVVLKSALIITLAWVAGWLLHFGV